MHRQGPPTQLRLACSANPAELLWPDGLQARPLRAKPAAPMEPADWATLVGRAGAFALPDYAAPPCQPAPTRPAGKSDPSGLSSVSL